MAIGRGVTLSLFICLSAILFSGVVKVVHAYNVFWCRWENSTVYYYYDNYNSSRGKFYIDIGADGWDSTDINFASDTAGNYNIYYGETNNPNVAWEGITDYTVTIGYIEGSATIQINMAQTKTWNDDGALQWVAIHEFGYALSLAHAENARAIMNPYTWGENSRYGDFGITTIQADDVNGANSLYGRRWLGWQEIEK